MGARRPIPADFVFPVSSSSYSAQHLEAFSPTQASTGPRCPMNTKRHMSAGFLAPQAPRNTTQAHCHTQVNLTFHAALLCGNQEACFPTVQRGPVLPTMTAHRRVPAPLSKIKNTNSFTEWKKVVICIIRTMQGWSASLRKVAGALPEKADMLHVAALVQEPALGWKNTGQCTVKLPKSC